MPYLFFPLLLLFLLTGKKVFGYGALVALAFMLVGALFGEIGEIFGTAKENDTVKTVLTWVGIAIGAVCIYFAMFW